MGQTGLPQFSPQNGEIEWATQFREGLGCVSSVTIMRSYDHCVLIRDLFTFEYLPENQVGMSSGPRRGRGGKGVSGVHPKTETGN
jgi:hypothetical protein